ncbi:MAG TPA: aminotransferase class III-fold pyridoxal phosphate-dependent enzyme, partial [Candidatus Angelobacter sp.]|nr:aminotransferase class III-fold pyridoxal phosphate-dependent enzyme [Candidatus Angelobacter sp.]
MTKDEIVKKHKQYLFPSISTYYSDPLVTDHASMQHLWDMEGNKYLDFFGGIVTISVGHTNPRVTGKIKAQIDKLQHASTVFPNEAVVALAEKIAQITPGEISQSFFSNSGTEANEFAVQLARMFTGRYEIVALRHGYSGRSQLAQSLTAHSPWRKSLPVPAPG